jgi:hypothetical protein
MPKKQNSAAPAPRKKAKRVRKKTQAASNPPADQSASAGAAAGSASAAGAKAAPHPRVRIGDAMRTTGLDEFKVAATFANVVDKLSGKTAGDGGVQKLLVDVLKECSRHLDAPSSDRDAKDFTGPITLIHCVPRPDRSPNRRPPIEAEPAGTVLDVKSFLPLPKEAP